MILSWALISLMTVLSSSRTVAMSQLSSRFSLCAPAPDPVKQNITYPQEHNFAKSILEAYTLVDNYWFSMHEAQRSENLEVRSRVYSSQIVSSSILTGGAQCIRRTSL